MKKVNKTLSLNRETISNLSNAEMNNINGGKMAAFTSDNNTVDTTCKSSCDSINTSFTQITHCC